MTRRVSPVDSAVLASGPSSDGGKRPLHSGINEGRQDGFAKAP